MKTFLPLVFLLILLSADVHADRKYGFLADSDETLLAKVRDPEIDAVILGCVYKDERPDPKGSKANLLHVTVVETYKGKLGVGDKVAVVIFAESVPSEEQELGALRFFLLSKKKPGHLYVPEGGFTAEWMDAARYSLYGEPMRKLLREGLK